MNPSRFALVLLAAAALLIGAGAQTFADGTAAFENRQIVRLLQERVEMKDFQQPMSLKEMLGLLMEKFAAKGKELPIVVEVSAFRKEHPDTEIYDEQVSFQPFPRTFPTAQILKQAFAKITRHEATFLIRDGTVVITTVKEASIERLLQRKVIADFANTPFADAVEELSAGTGASIVLDIRLGDKLRSPVTASLKNDTSLESALRMLADMVDLKVVVLPAGIYVTHPFHADNLEKELPKRSRIHESKLLDSKSKRR